MDFLTPNFGQLLYLLDDELKNTIRNFEKQKKLIISAQYGILFNQTYIYIYVYLQPELWHVTMYYYMHFASLLHVITAGIFIACILIVLWTSVTGALLLRLAQVGVDITYTGQTLTMGKQGSHEHMCPRLGDTSLVTHSVIPNKVHCVHQCTLILRTVLSLYYFFFILCKSGMRIVI